MSDDFVGARAKIIALEAARNLLIDHYGRDAMRILRYGIVEEIRKLAAEDMNLASKAIDYAQDEVLTSD